MRINEFLIESQELEEGPLLNKIGSGIGKAVGSAAKGVGAVAGGIAGVGKAFKKGWDAGKQTVGTGGDEEDDFQPTSTASSSAPASTTATSTATAPAKKLAPAASTAQASAAKPAPTGSQYAQVKAAIDKLDKKGKQRILAGLNKELGTAAPAAPTTAQAEPAAPATAQAEPAASTAQAEPAAAPVKTKAVKKSPPVQQVEPAAAPVATDRVMKGQGGRQLGTKQSEPGANFDTQTGKMLPGRAINAVRRKSEVGAGVLGKTRAKLDKKKELQAASKINTGNALAESLAKKVEEHKKQLFAEELQTGKISIYKK